MFKLILLSAIFAVCLSAPTPIVDSDEIAILSQSQPCRGRVAGTRLRHPTDDHKYLRCVGPESFWIETCPDNLFFNQELDLCDWTPISETTTAVNDIVKFRPVLFKNNKTVDQEVVEVISSRPVVDKSKLPVRVVSSRIRDDTDVAEVRQVPVVVETDEIQVAEPEVIRRVTTTTVRPPVKVVEPVVVEVEEEEPVRMVSQVVKTPVTKRPIVVEDVLDDDEEHSIVRPKGVSKPISTRRPAPAVSSLEEIEVIKPRPVIPTVEEVEVVRPRPAVATVEEVEVIKPRPAVATLEEVEVIKPKPTGVTVQKPVTIVEPVDFTPKPIKFIARPGANNVRVFGALGNLAAPRAGLPFSTADVIRTDFVNHKTLEPTVARTF